MAVERDPAAFMRETPNPNDIERVRQILSTRQRRALHIDSLAPAAVLIPLFDFEDALHMLFTLRTDTVRHHKGQVSFPGGARHDDDPDLLATALRESCEEIGLQAHDVDVLGALDDMPTISHFQVTPFVARIRWPIELIASPHEIADVFSVPLSRLLDPQLCRLEERVYQEQRYYPVYYFEGGKHVVWGITGHILAHFLTLAFDWRHPDLRADAVYLGRDLLAP